MKYVPSIINWKQSAFYASLLGVCVGIFLGGALSEPYLRPYNPYAVKQSVVVKEVKVASIDMTAKRTQEMCAAAADTAAKMHQEFRDWKAKAAAKIAPAK